MGFTDHSRLRDRGTGGARRSRRDDEPTAATTIASASASGTTVSASAATAAESGEAERSALSLAAVAMNEPHELRALTPGQVKVEIKAEQLCRALAWFVEAYESGWRPEISNPTAAAADYCQAKAWIEAVHRKRWGY